MGEKNMPLSRRAWKLLRLALWSRKRGVFKRRLMMDIRLFLSYIKSLCYNPSHRLESIHYREHEFSFDETPIFHFRMRHPSSMRFRIPCLNTPSVDFDYDFEDDALCYNNHHPDANGYDRKSILTSGNEREEGDDLDDCESEDDARRSSAMVSSREKPQENDAGEIDLKAEEFIAKFYDQMKLQRQISYLQYHDMLSRGTS
ncbi:uncharacterized protein LOC122091752 [Macadamia integrifolia]|uniref:uncharacterized protein LOC122091752 n=1 Tax=Macadamia integrifolia TaxID=60698 RepID=UPI001C4E691A|nr:uncharacterized protein LOC122091752 [Macadamia integrifolia]